MELRHLQRAFDHANSRTDAIAVIRKHGGKSTPDSVPAANIEACTHEMRALNSGGGNANARPQNMADLHDAAYANWNNTTGRTTG